MDASDRILDAIDNPAQLKLLSDDELTILAREIREEIVSVTSRTGGHVGSSLGAVEIILAVHSLIDAPTDRFVFDVGHQSYAHKLITGRRKEFQNLRHDGGVSGFPKPSESEYDVHPSGHASDSLSVALGLAMARDLCGGHEKIVALIGDAAIAGGMAFEALNQIGQAQTPMVIILNDNEMSISRNVGGLMKHFGRLRSSAGYRTRRDSIQEQLETRGPIGQFAVHVGRSAKDSLKQFFLPHSMVFEELGIVCTPPIDGHDIRALKEMLSTALAADGPVLVHVVTKKGAGYEPAIKDPETFHGVGPYDIATGELIKSNDGPMTYTAAFGHAIIEEANHNPNIVAFTAAMKSGTGLSQFAKWYPARFVDGGIAEQHVVGMAAGYAIGGKKPVVAIYSTFLQRAIDQAIVDVSLANLDIVFCLDRAGVVGEDGPTHHGVFDLVYMRMIPNMRILAPSNEAELVNDLHTALALGGPFAIRYPRGKACGVELPIEPVVYEEGCAHVVREGNDAAILSFGSMLMAALEAATLLEGEGISVRVVDMRWVKPLDLGEISRAALTGVIVTVEEGVIAGGAGSGVLEAMVANDIEVEQFVQLGLPDRFIMQGNRAQLLAEVGLSAEGIADTVRRAYRVKAIQ